MSRFLPGGHAHVFLKVVVMARERCLAETLPIVDKEQKGPFEATSLAPSNL